MDTNVTELFSLRNNSYNSKRSKSCKTSLERKVDKCYITLLVVILLCHNGRNNSENCNSSNSYNKSNSFKRNGDHSYNKIWVVNCNFVGS